MFRTAISLGQEIPVCNGTFSRALVRIIYVRGSSFGWWRPKPSTTRFRGHHPDQGDGPSVF